MGTTPNLSFPFPELGGENNPPADIQALAQALDVILSAAVTYTPTVTATASPAATATYILIGKWITVEFDILLTAALTGNPTVSLPSGMTFAVAQARGIGTAILTDASPASSRIGLVSVSNASAISMSYEQSNVRTGLTATAPWTWAAGDSMRGSFTARLA